MKISTRGSLEDVAGLLVEKLSRSGHEGTVITSKSDRHAQTLSAAAFVESINNPAFLKNAIKDFANPGHRQLKAAMERIVKSTEKEMDDFLDCFKLKTYKKKELLLEEGNTCRHIWFVNKGLIRDFYYRNKSEYTTNFVFEDNFVSDYGSFLSQKPAKKNIDALEDCETLMISYEAIQQQYIKSQVWERAGRLIAENLFLNSERKKDDLLSSSPELQYTSLIQNQPYLLQRVPQYYIASFLGISPEHLSRIRKKM